MPNKQKDRKQKRQEELGRFVEPLTGKAYKRERRAAEREQFRPITRQLQGEKRAEKTFRQRAKSYFDTYGDAVNKAASTSSTATQSALDKTNAASAAASANDAKLRAENEAYAQKDAQLRGASYTPSTQSTAASANRTDSAAAIAAVTAGQGAAQQRYLADKSRIGEGERRNQLLRSHARSRTINSDKRDVAKAKSDFRKDYRSRTRESERQFYLSQQQLADSAKGRNSQMKLAKQYAKNERKSQNRSLRNQQAIASQQAANAAADDARSRKYAKKYGGSKGGKDSGPEVAAGDIRSYIAQNASPSDVANNPKVAIQKVRNRWPGLDPGYVRRIVLAYGRGSQKPAGEGGHSALAG